MIPHYLKSGTITKTGRMISSYSDRIGGGSFKAKKGSSICKGPGWKGVLRVYSRHLDVLGELHS